MNLRELAEANKLKLMAQLASKHGFIGLDLNNIEINDTYLDRHKFIYVTAPIDKKAFGVFGPIILECTFELKIGKCQSYRPD